MNPNFFKQNASIAQVTNSPIMLPMFVSRKGLVQLQGTVLLQTDLLLAQTEISAPNTYLFPSMFHFPALLPLQSSHLFFLHRFSGDDSLTSFSLFSNIALSQSFTDLHISHVSSPDPL